MVQQMNKYNHIDDAMLPIYLESLVNKVFKILPMREENSPTLKDYITSLLYELTGMSSVFYNFQASNEYLTLVFDIESLAYIDNMQHFRSKVFESISLVKKMNERK